MKLTPIEASKLPLSSQMASLIEEAQVALNKAAEREASNLPFIPTNLKKEYLKSDVFTPGVSESNLIKTLCKLSFSEMLSSLPYLHFSGVEGVSIKDTSKYRMGNLVFSLPVSVYEEMSLEDARTVIAAGRNSGTRADTFESQIPRSVYQKIYRNNFAPLRRYLGYLNFKLRKENSCISFRSFSFEPISESFVKTEKGLYFESKVSFVVYIAVWSHSARASFQILNPYGAYGPGATETNLEVLSLISDDDIFNSEELTGKYRDPLGVINYFSEFKNFMRVISRKLNYDHRAFIVPD